MKKIPLLLLMITSLAGCGGGPLSLHDQFDLIAAEERWRKRAFENYSYEIRQICFCPVELTRFVRVNVQDDSVVAVTDVETGTPYPADLLLFWPTVDELFRGLHRLRANQGIEKVTAQYDPDLGYPRYIRSEAEEGVADGGSTVETRALISTP